MNFFNILLLIIFCVMPAAFTRSNKPLIIAHRGASAIAPENTLSSIQLAWNLGVKAVEIDVRLTKDKKVVLMHDSNTHRTSGESLEVSETDLETLKKLDVGKLKGPRFIGEKIITLEEALATVPPNARLFVELKSGTEIIEPISQVIDNYEHTDRLTVIAFDYETLKQFKSRHPEILAYWLMGPTYRHLVKNPKNRNYLISLAKHAKFDGIDVEKSLANLAFQKEAQWEGLEFLVWVVNDSGTLSRLVNLGVDGITTDRPQNNFSPKRIPAVDIARFQLRTVL